jgi:hypothetical protein
MALASHASDVVLNKLFSLRHLDNSNCDICHFSKQTRLSFTLSTNKTSKAFENICISANMQTNLYIG